MVSPNWSQKKTTSLWASTSYDTPFVLWSVRRGILMYLLFNFHFVACLLYLIKNRKILIALLFEICYNINSFEYEGSYALLWSCSCRNFFFREGSYLDQMWDHWRWQFFLLLLLSQFSVSLLPENWWMLFLITGGYP